MRLKRFLLLLLGMIFFAPAAGARTVYVNRSAPGATHDGASWTTAFQTVARGLASAGRGDEVWVARGTYAENRLSPASGVSLYGGFIGTEVRRDQRDCWANVTLLDGRAHDIVHCYFSDVVMDGFTVRNGYDGVYIAAERVILSNNTISWNANNGVFLSGGTATLSGNVISLNGGSGVDVAEGSAILTRNTISDNDGDGVGIHDEATLYSNVLEGNLCGAGVSAGQAIFVNNTMSGNTFGVSVFGGTVALTNNIIAASEYSGLSLYVPGVISTFSHNDVSGNRGNYFGFTPPAGQGNIEKDPRFVDRADGEYQLKPYSPCINAGDDAAAGPGDLDLDGRPRKLGAHVDIGACEYPTSGYFSLSDVRLCLTITGGLTPASTADFSRLNVEPEGSSVDILDSLRLTRKAAGLESNP